MCLPPPPPPPDDGSISFKAPIEAQSIYNYIKPFSTTADVEPEVEATCKSQSAEPDNDHATEAQSHFQNSRDGGEGRYYNIMLLYMMSRRI